MASIDRTWEPKRLYPGDRVTYSGYDATVIRLYDESAACEGGRMYEIRLARGVACVCGADLIPSKG